MSVFNDITIFTPTEAEATALAAVAAGAGAALEVSGVGMARTAAAVISIGQATGLAILAGIAGAYPGSAFVPGDCAVAATETVADLGAVRGGEFMPLFLEEFTCPLAGEIGSVRTAGFATVNCIDPGRPHPSGAAIENMEGAAFFAAMLSLGIPFLEIRAVSNLTTDDRTDWQIPLALGRLGEAVAQVISELRGQ
ncbi:MAG: hypothetical protein LUF87_00865 [Alistipes sp.]|nr:hypothetical protein [Alistipes sp.]